MYGKELGMSRALTLGTDPKQVPVGYGCNELGLLEPCLPSNTGAWDCVRG